MNDFAYDFNVTAFPSKCVKEKPHSSPPPPPQCYQGILLPESVQRPRGIHPLTTI